MGAGKNAPRSFLRQEPIKFDGLLFAPITSKRQRSRLKKNMTHDQKPIIQ